MKNYKAKTEQSLNAIANTVAKLVNSGRLMIFQVIIPASKLYQATGLEVPIIGSSLDYVAEHSLLFWGATLSFKLLLFFKKNKIG